MALKHRLFSVLDTDMKVSCVFVAVAKARSGLSITDDERKQARELTDALLQYKANAFGGIKIPSELVPDADLRGLLEQGLAEIPRANEESPLTVETLSRTAAALQTLSGSGRLERGEADMLLSTLEGIGAPVELEGSLSMLLVER